MREIKFRFWDGKQMYNWNWASDVQTEYVFNPDVEVWEVMQATGLRDKHGKEVWEGDVVTWVNAYIIPQVSFIKWDNEHGWWGVDSLPNSAFGTSMKNSKSDFGVIGNIYENPDLLANN